LTARRITKKLTRLTAYIVGVILVLLVAFHFWFVNHAGDLLEELVHDRSNGKLSLKIDKFSFNWLNRKIELRKAIFYSTDTLTASSAYQFSVERLRIQMKQILPLILEKRFLIDSIQIVNPDITVTRLRPGKDTAFTSDTSFSIPQEMGRIYNSIQDALAVLEVGRFQIDNGKFSLINRIRPDDKPIIISRLNFYLDNLEVADSNTSDGHSKILFSDNVGLSTTNQDILLPDGRHRISFSNFRINVHNRLAEFDSCTIVATKGDSVNNSFRIFFDKLRMTNIDFDTLYHTEVIKADSVYCINPKFRLDVELPKRTGPIKPPKLDELIQQLTGNLQLAFVVVQNASFDINTMREGRPSSFTSDKNNFELQGLRIQENALQPLTVERFAMAIRNYENFLRDSTYAISFDSILVNNNRISLSNFSYKELKNNKVVNSLMMPQFEVQGLSWDNLVFDQQLNAQRVNLYRPVINYNTKNKAGSQDIFEVLGDIGNVFQLENLNMTEGELNLFLPDNSSLKLEGASMAVSGKKLVGSRGIASVQRSVNQLSFRKGVFKTKDLTARLENANFTGVGSGITAQKINLTDKNDLVMNATRVSIRSMILDEKFKHNALEGIRWEKADISMSALPGRPQDDQGSFTLREIDGTNTRINIRKGPREYSVFLKSVNADQIETGNGRPVQLSGFTTSGNDLVIKDSIINVTIKNLSLTDRKQSSLEKIRYTSNSGRDSMLIEIPAMNLVPDINAMLNGKIQADGIQIFQPFAQINLFASGETVRKTGLQNVFIGSLQVRQPALQFRSTSVNGQTTLEWKGKDGENFFELSNFRVNQDSSMSISADQLKFSIDQFQFVNAKGKKFEAGKGQLNAQINKLAFFKNEMETWDWQGTVAHLDASNFVIDSLGKNDGLLLVNSARLDDLTISSSLLLDIRAMVNQNSRFNLHHITGGYKNSQEQYAWYNAGYDKKTNFFSLDSFSFHPVVERDEYLKSKPYQVDYLTAKTGRITMGPFDIHRYNRDTILAPGIITIDGGYMHAYRDKRTPRQPGAIKSLPVNLLKKLPVQLLADSIRITNALVDYEEVNEKTGALGKITVARLNGIISNARNFNLQPGDSLQISASGFLQDTLFTKLSVRESYTDSLGGFLMTAQMGPSDLTVMNTAIASLASAELKSGILDTMTLRVVGREALAFGEMKMYYHDLKVKVQRPGKKTLMSGLATFVANTLIKNKNRNRTGTIFILRMRDRSAINYLVKIAMSGIASSVGVKGNKKLIRKYKREIRSRNLPVVM
jgi:hypothetical protein